MPLIHQHLKYIVATLIALTAHFFLSRSHEGWLLIVTLLTMCTAPGCAVYQGLWRYIWASIIIVALSFSVLSHAFLVSRLSDATIGALIGIVINVMVFPDRADTQFREACIPVWNAYIDYFSSIVSLLSRTENDIEQTKRKTIQSMTALPGWVYETGFDKTLKSGYCYVLMKTERVADLLLSMHYLVSASGSREMGCAIQEPCRRYADLMAEWMRSLTSVLALQPIAMGVDDGLIALQLIEETLEKMKPPALAWAESFKDYLRYEEFVYCLRELRAILFDLSLSTAPVKILVK